MSRKEDKPLETTPRLQTAEREALVRQLLRLPELFAIAATRVTPVLFHRNDEQHLKLLWQVSTELAESLPGKRLPDDPGLAWSMVGARVDAQLEYSASTDRMERAANNHCRQLLFGSPEEAGQGGLLYWIYGSDDALDANWGRHLLQRFLRERTVDDTIKRAVLNADDHSILVHLPAILADVQQRYHQVQNLGGTPYRSAAPAGYVPPALGKTPTNLDFFDEYLNGGEAAGEVYGILGAYGAGKTSLAVQLAYQKGLYFQSQAELGQPLKHSFLFCYEANFDEIMIRTWSHAARIHKDSLEELDQDLANLSRRGSLKAYEKQLLRSEILHFGEDNVDGEYERLMQTHALLDTNIQICDFSSERGTGYIDEIAAALEQARRDGKTPGSVYIDYAGLCCRRHLMAHNRPLEHMRHFVGDFGNQCRSKIAEPFRVSVWIFHQLSAAANARSFAARQHHSDSAEAKNFAENLWFCFELSVPDQEHSCVRLSCTKHRRAPGLKKEPLLYLRGQYSSFERADDLMIDPTLGRPVPKSEAAQVHPLALPGPDMNLTGFEDP